MLRCPAKEEMSSPGERQEEPRVVVGRQSADRGGVALFADGAEGDGLLERQVGTQAVQDVAAGDEDIARVDVE